MMEKIQLRILTWSYVDGFVQSALDGYNICIFAYGQTGSGKTYTMEGPSGSSDSDDVGMIPRAVTQVFETAAQLMDKGWQVNPAFFDVSIIAAWSAYSQAVLFIWWILK